MNAIANKTLQTLDFHISATRYFEEGFLHFTDINNLELTAILVVDNPGQVVTDPKKEVVKKKKHMTKRKKRLKKLCAFIPNSAVESAGTFWSPSFIPLSATKSIAFLLPYSVSTSVSHFGSSIFCCFFLYPLWLLDLWLFYCLILCPLLFLVLDFLLFYHFALCLHLVLCPLQLFLISDF